jgi:hypothetical protein
MIEDKEIGLKMTESKTETLWAEMVKNTKLRIESLENTQIIEKAVLEMAEAKLAEEQAKLHEKV